MVGYLNDNHVNDHHFYLMTVYTGMRRSAGTKSNVQFVLKGKNGTSRVRQLKDGERVSFINLSLSLSLYVSLPSPFSLYFKCFQLPMLINPNNCSKHTIKIFYPANTNSRERKLCLVQASIKQLI